MTFSGLQAEPDLLGLRVRLFWRYTLSSGEKVSGVPRVQLARKQLDYEFPSGLNPDPFVVYDSGAFPPAGLALTTISSADRPYRAGRKTEQVESAAGASGEILRLTTRIAQDASGNPQSIEFELLDSGGLEPLTAYYYELRPAPWNPSADLRSFHASARTTNRYGLGRTMYGLLPEIYRRHDVSRPAVPPQLAAVPEAADTGGQLERFLEIAGSAADYLRSRAEGMLAIHDLRTVDASFLPLMAAWIGWNLDFRASIPIQRHEIRYASALYRLTGSTPGCMIWVRRLTGWDARIKEFGRNVFFSNDVGDPDDPAAKGSFTVDTSNAALVANIRTFDDQLTYTYDGNDSNDSWYAYNVVGIYLKPAAGSTVAQVTSQMNRLLSNLSLFLPVNVRGVVILDIPAAAAPVTAGYALLNAQEQ